MPLNLSSDHPVTDEACHEATGKTLTQWFAYFDEMDGLKLGRRALNVHLYELKIDPWWCTTLVVEYEKARDQRKKDGLYEGYFICSTKTIAAPVDKVFAAWKDPETLSEWFGEGVSGTVEDGATIETASGIQGKVERVRDSKDIRITFEGGGFTAPSQIDVQFQDKGNNKTGLLVNHTRLQTRDEADGARNEWADALTRLKGVCEGG